MEQNRIDLWSTGEYEYPHAFGFLPNLHTYLHDEDADKRPFFLVVPGGGYNYCTESEGEIVARAFYERGYQAAVLTYTCNLLSMEPLFDQPLKDIVRAVRMIRSGCTAFRTLPDRITVCGFSAGAHLSGMLGEYHDTISDLKYPEVSAAPDRLILSYPVITSGRFAHRGSFAALLGTDVSEEELKRVSLELHVREDMCPVFLWQTAADESVPVENSYLMAMALREKKIPFEHHVFETGGHGLSVATEEWRRRKYADIYTLEQVYRILDAVQRGELIPKDDAAAKQLAEKFRLRKDPDYFDASKKANLQAAKWVDLCSSWLARSYGD